MKKIIDMKKMEFKTNINAPAQKVWDTMMAPDTYREWVNASWPGSYYEGNWKQGEHLKFLMPGQGGIMANVAECRPYERSVLQHIALIKSDGTEDRNSEEAQKWVGATETYEFREQNGTTELTVIMNVSPAWEQMLLNDWPKALAALKEICER